MSKNEITAKKVAEVLGVSPSTISMVLNNKGDEYRISAETQKKIFDTVQELGYKHVGRKKRETKSFNKKLICFFCGLDFNRGPTSLLMEGAVEYFKEMGLNYETILFPFELGKLEEKAQWISSKFVSGAIMVALDEKDLTFLEKNKFDIPLIMLNRTARGYCSVMSDGYSVGQRAMEIFLERGHRSFGIVSPKYSSRGLSLRNVGFFDRLDREGFKDQETFAAPISYADSSDLGGYSATNKLLSYKIIPTAIFVTSDTMISGVVRSIQEKGLDIPGDIELISYGNQEINQTVKPTITSFVLPTGEMGYNCARIIHDYIEKGIFAENINLSFDAGCIFRESCPAEKSKEMKENIG